MAVRLKNVEDQVIVLTGASSGIGLATARMAAERGAKLVLAARDEDALKQLTEEIQGDGGQATYVAADVGDEKQVAKIARAAVQRFGGFDTWVNNAAAAIYGGLLDISTADSKRLFDTNFWGVVFGSLEAAHHLRKRQGDYGGAIINVGSEVSDRAIPVLGMYSASKHAVKGFTDALRMELEKEGAPISVTLIKPGSIDTPFPLHAKNYMEEEPQVPPPVYAPEVVADAILHCAETPERDMFVGASAKRHSLQAGIMPRLMDWFMEEFFFNKQKSGRMADRSHEALHRPTTGLRERGRSKYHVRESSLYTKASMHPLLTGAVLAGAGLAVAAVFTEVMSHGGHKNGGES